MNQNNLRNIFKKGDKHVLDLQDWEKYFTETSFEKKVTTDFYKKVFNDEEISLGVFYKDERREIIDHIAWGPRKNKDCSFNGKVNRENFVENIFAGCPCEDEPTTSPKSYFQKYKSIIYFLVMITVLSYVLSSHIFSFNIHAFMSYYMGLFFVIFGVLKLVNYSAFVNLFSSYDPLAAKFPLYAKNYPYLEIFLGLLYFYIPINFFLNLLVLIIFSFNTYGIWGVLKRRENISCACMGGVFEVPLSKVTLFENFVMIAMSFWMIIG